MNEVKPFTGDQPDEIDFMELDNIIEVDFNTDPENLIMILQAIQGRYNYLPGPAPEISFRKNRRSFKPDLRCRHFLQHFQPRTEGQKHRFRMPGDRLSRARR